MKNFKKVLALVLAVATLLSFATIASAVSSSSYKDAADITKNGQTEAIDVLSGIGVLTGYPDTTFKPNQDITRAEAAKIIAMFDNGATDISALYKSANPFVDAKGNWAESYIAYGYKAGIIAGVGKLNFAPSAKLTGVQFLKMVLVVLGYDAKAEGLEGTSWAVNTLALAKKAGLLSGLGSSFDVAANLTRGQAAQIMLNALKASTVEYGQQYKFTPAEIQKLTNGQIVTVTNGVNYMTVAGAIKTGVSLAESDWSLSYVSSAMDVFGRPGHSWNKFSDNKVTTTVKYGPYIDTPLATYTVATKKCDVIKDISTDYSGSTFTTYTNGTYNKSSVKMTDTSAETIGAQGRLTEVYDGVIVYIDTYLAKVTNVVPTKKDVNGHVTDPVTTVYVYDNTETINAASLTYGTEAFKVGDFVLVTAAKTTAADGYAIQSMDAATSKTGKLTGLATTFAAADLDIQNVKAIDAADVTVNYTAIYKAIAAEDNKLALNSLYTFFYDAKGNVIGVTDASSNYVVIDSIYTETASGNATVTANLVKPDATKLSGKVHTINNSTILNVDADKTKNTGAYYHQLYTYTTNTDGTYNLNRTGYEAVAARYTAGSLEFNANSTRIQISTSTVFLLQSKDSPDGTFATYTGYDKLPSFSGEAEIVMDNANRYASIVYVRGTVNSNKTVFVTNIADGRTDSLENGYYKLTLNVLKLSDDGKSLVPDTIVAVTTYANVADAADSLGISSVGLYDVSLDGNTYYYKNMTVTNPINGATKYQLRVVTDLATDRVTVAAFNGDLNTLGANYNTLYLDASKPLYTRWEEAADHATATDITKTNTYSDLKTGDLVYVQYKDVNNNGAIESTEVVAVYDMYKLVNVTATKTTTGDYNAKLSYAKEYLNKTFNTITVNIADNEKIADAKMNENTLDYTTTPKTVAYTTTKVTGNITINIADNKQAGATLKSLNVNSEDITLSDCVNSYVEATLINGYAKIKTVTVNGTDGSFPITWTLSDDSTKATVKVALVDGAKTVAESNLAASATAGNYSAPYGTAAGRYFVITVSAEDAATQNVYIVKLGGGD